jgi:MFS family permease
MTALVAAAFTPLSARMAERVGARLLITTGLVCMTAGLAILAVVPSTTPVWALAALMVLVGVAGPLVSLPITGAQKIMGDFAPALVGFTDDVLFGQVWKREQLSPKERSLVTVACLTTSGNFRDGTD